MANSLSLVILYALGVTVDAVPLFVGSLLELALGSREVGLVWPPL